jgi:multicomponent Na+:H+ antiporter subunit E
VNEPRSVSLFFRQGTALVLQALALFALWLLLSGRLEARYLAMGAIAVGVVLFLAARAGGRSRWGIGRALGVGGRFLVHLVWLLGAIVKANLQVAAMVLHPRMPIDPVLFQFHTPLRGPLAQTLLATSITITPGTITVDLGDGLCTVHTLAPPFLSSLASGEVQRRVGRVFGVETGGPPPARTAYSLDALER